METFPQISSGSSRILSGTEPLAKYPVSTSINYKVEVVRFLNDSEQRWVIHDKLFSAVLEYKEVNGYDFSRISEFFHFMKGRYVDSALLNTFSFTIFGVQYDYCTFDQDELVATENRIGLFDFTLSFKQLRRN